MVENQNGILYHATFGAYLNSIKMHGLGAVQHKNWDFSQDGVVCLCADKHAAISFCEAAEDVEQAIYDSGIICFAVNVDSLNLDRLKPDPNISDAVPGAECFVYEKIIPYSKLHLTDIDRHQDPNYDLPSIYLEARLGINFKVSPAEFDVLCCDDYHASQELFLQIIASDRCNLGGDTYLPGSWNEDYLNDDLNFYLPERPLHDKPIGRHQDSNSDLSSIHLEARLGINFKVSPAEFDVLCCNDYKASQELFLQIIASDRCNLGGDTYLPGPWNEDYLNDDLNFDLPEQPLHDKPQVSLNSIVQSAESRAATQQSNQESPSKGPER